jgi:GntR family transcriptional regulator
MIDKKSPIPAYYQIKEDIKNRIKSGEWKSGEAIDSERKISDTYQVSRMTVRQAIGELEKESIIEREKGRGTFVSSPRVTQHNIMSFTDMASAGEMKSKTLVLSFDRIPVPERYAPGIEGPYVYFITRLRYIDDQPIGIESVYVPVYMLEGVEKVQLEGSLFLLLEERGYSIKDSEASIQACHMNKGYMEVFGTNTSLPLIKINTKYMCSKGNGVFFEESVYNSDKYVLKVHISKKEASLTL